MGSQEMSRTVKMTNLATTSLLFGPPDLPGGQVIPNRIAKAAMEENMASRIICPAMTCSSFTGDGPQAAQVCSLPAM